MSDPCPLCGKDRVLVGQRHHCTPLSVKQFDRQSVDQATHIEIPLARGNRVPERDKYYAADVRNSFVEKRQPGGVRIEDRSKTHEAMKPWVALGMSRRTWYRRKKLAT